MKKFGYYKCGTLETYSKWEAIEHEKRSGFPISWHFNDEVFGKLDWTVEPQIDIWDLYCERARQIRKDYDYVVLFFSGGSDSTNVLQAWLSQDLKIDEIATIWNYEASKDLYDHCNAEITNVVLPTIKQLQEKHEFKFRLIDNSQMSVQTFDVFGLDYEYWINRYFSVNNPSKALLREEIDDYRNMINSGKKVCFVWGIEKPMIGYDGGYYFNFMDAFDNNVSPYVQHKQDCGWYDELFYWSADNPLIPIKQAHILKRFVTTVNDPLFYTKDHTNFGYNSTLQMYLNDDTVKKLIYPKWDPNTFCNGKAKSFIYSDRDSWFLNSNLELKTRYDNIVKRIVKLGGNKYIHNNNIVPHCSTKYRI